MASVTEITLQQGETFSLALKGKGSSGYSWVCDLSGDRDAVEVRLGPVAQPSHAPHEKPHSGSVDEVLIVRALSIGKVVISLAQRRSWERDRPALSEHLLTVTVRG